MATKKNEKLPKIPPVTIENAILRYKNFSGAAKKFNAKGLRNFHVVLPGDLAKMLERDGWNVRWHEPNEDRGEDAWASLKIAVRFDNYPPRIVLVTKHGRTMLDEDTVELLDSAEISRVDLQISPSRWETADGKRGVKAYLAKLFVELSEDDLELKWSDVASAKQNSDVDDD